MSTEPDESANSMTKPRSKTGYFSFVRRVEGQKADFVLPEGASACPIKHCPRYMVPCHPHWRINEHMKTRHGWPRKNTQPNNDRRLNGLHRSDNYPRPSAKPLFRVERPLKQKDDSFSSGLSSADSQILEHQKRTKRNAKKPNGMHQSFLEGKQSESPEFNDSISMQLDDADEGISAQSNIIKHDVTRDEQMINEIERFVSLLEASTPNGNSITPGRSKLIQSYKQLITEGMIRVNCIMSAEQGLRLMTLYKELSRRAEQQSSVYKMSSGGGGAPSQFRSAWKSKGQTNSIDQHGSAKSRLTNQDESRPGSSASTISAPSSSFQEAKIPQSDVQMPPNKKIKLKLNMKPANTRSVAVS